NPNAGGTTAVHEQGTANVNVTNTVASADVDQRTAVRFGPKNFFTGQQGDTVLVPTDAIPAGKKFIVTYFHLVGISNSSSDPLVSGGCFTRLLTLPATSAPFGSIPLQRNDEALVGSETAFLPFSSGEGLGVACRATTASGNRENIMFVLSVGGYFVV